MLIYDIMDLVKIQMNFKIPSIHLLLLIKKKIYDIIINLPELICPTYYFIRVINWIVFNKKYNYELKFSNSMRIIWFFYCNIVSA
jgi:hypothetical protein